MGLEWKSLETDTPCTHPGTSQQVAPLTQQEWNMLFENHLELQINPSYLTRNIEVINELRQRVWLELTKPDNNSVPIPIRPRVTRGNTSNDISRVNDS